VVAACASESSAKRVDIGGRMMYIECHGSGSPTVLLISGTDTASDLFRSVDDRSEVRRCIVPDTHSGHNIKIDNAPVVIQAIRMVVDAVRVDAMLAVGVAMAPQHFRSISDRSGLMGTR
jgi:hypothetical protein